ncbi:Coronin-like protein crn1 [Rhizophagus irregularis]|uniref:Coronin-like protein crn1 n=1 Tax=Rhizophagus irregularis TaxID=588596 RepID=UPI001A01DA98|nr:Coronin-like protein crn1 [Rhizophagus irregularis]GET51951.1 hypothetical protein GLOIN_2v1774909 [Rhizophagus irregularis DAOM 181602=DAOM 197198]
MGIVTDAEKWYFMECRLDSSDRRPSIKLSEPVIVVYKDENLQSKVEKVLGYIVWLLEEAQKPVDDSQSGEESRRVKSLSKIAEKSDTVDSS